MLDNVNSNAIQHCAPFESMLQKSTKSGIHCYLTKKKIPRDRLILGLSTQGFVMKAKSIKNNYYYLDYYSTA